MKTQVIYICGHVGVIRDDPMFDALGLFVDLVGPDGIYRANVDQPCHICSALIDVVVDYTTISRDRI